MVLAPDIVASVARRLAEHAGLALPGWVVDARAHARIEELGVTPAAYVELIASGRGASELAMLVEAVRVGESSLFRHRAQIAALVEAVAPALRAKSKRAVKVWSAGCAGGEEPYTLAAVLTSALPGVAVSIVATDVSADALAAARLATYRADAVNDVPDEWRDGFVIEGSELHVRPDLAALVTFEKANLLDAAPPRNCDLVWCRNVLIYFSADARRRVIDRLIAALAPGGLLFVGYSETLRDVSTLEVRRHGDTVFYAKPEKETTSPGIESYRTPPYGTQLPPRRTSSVSVPTLWGDASDAREITVVSAVVPPPPTTSATQKMTLVGQPAAHAVTALIGQRLGVPGIERLIIDLDPAEMLGDDLAPVLRRARAAAGTARVAIELRATKPGTKRWLSRHGLAAEEDAP